MKLCPVCHENVEGLVHHCDFCGASLDEKNYNCLLKSLGMGNVKCASIAMDILDHIEEMHPHKYEDFLQTIGFVISCPCSDFASSEPRKTKVYYSKLRKTAKVTVVVDNDQFMASSPTERVRLVSRTLRKGFLLLEDRLKKYNHNIDELMEKGNHVFDQMDTYKEPGLSEIFKIK